MQSPHSTCDYGHILPMGLSKVFFFLFLFYFVLLIEFNRVTPINKIMQVSGAVP